MAERMRRITRSLPAVLTLAACVLATPALGQIDTLPTPDKTSYSQAEKQELQAFVSARLDLIGGSDAPAREKARRELLAPLGRPGVSVAFRRAFREASLDQLGTLAASTDDAVAINALVVLGEIADDQARQIVQRHTADERVAVRYASIAAMTRTFRAIDQTSPAIDAGRVTEMVRHLTDRLEAEPDASVADAIVRSLLAAASIDRDGFATPATIATTGLGAGVGARLRAAEDTDRQVTLMTAVRAAEAFAGRLAAAGTVSPEAARAGAGFAGEVLAHLAYRAREGDMPAADGWEADLVTLSERNIVFAALKLGGRITAPGLPALVESGDASGFYTAVSELVLGLNAKPCDLPQEDMQRIRDALAGK
ncbi:MAG: hypothetical protein Q9O74_11955 [Planctomycetota bacterium]|nr:hypothetical protein [Planctomycetota bacterium]